MRKLACVLATLGMMIGLASTLVAQELQEGKWAIRVTQPNGNIVNITLEVNRTFPDPHARWRLGAGKLVTFTAMRGQNAMQIRDVSLDGEKLSWLAEGPIARCSLTRQKDGSYAGECVNANGGGAKRPITMALQPPAPPAPAQK